jgi:hypothetical protein
MDGQAMRRRHVSHALITYSELAIVRRNKDL